jgi:ABC-type antimicrobial peptide transport system permease subunit
VLSVNKRLVVEPQKLSDLVDQTLLVQHLVARLTGVFAMLGLLLACIGVYGLMSYLTSTRTKEIGIRMALGATRGDVLWSVLRQTLGVIACGVTIGLALAVGGARLVASQLFGMTADPGALLAATVLISAAALLAAYLPARRASKIDPLRALKYE